MFSKIASFFAATLTIFLLAGPASALTPGQIQATWAKQGQLTGSFVTQYSDGSRSEGLFRFDGPERLTLQYAQTGGQTIFSGRGIQIIDVKYPTNNQSRSDGRLGAVFSKRPTFTRYVSSKGSTAELTMLRFSAEEGSLQVYFSNRTGQLEYLVTNGDGGDITTRFFYK